ncbi:MAG: hypothetical protein JXB14_04890 [Candidatus Altiarchaeota archaeon]|nr:hypothetical protein [Candidatus Altiarchaeota archaeon]
MPEDKGFSDLLDSLVEDVTKDEEKPLEEKEAVTQETNHTLPLLIDEKTATEICKDILKEKNLRKYEFMGVELVFRPYWFFTYTCQLVFKDPDGNIADSEEIGGREAIDAVTGQLADYLPEVMESEPIEVVVLEEELENLEGGAKVENPRIREDELKEFIQQKVSGVLRANKENVSVAGFELLYSPVWKTWLTIKKRTHNVQVCGTTGIGVNYDELPLSPKTWRDVIIDDIKQLRDPKKWFNLLKKTTAGAPTGTKKSGGFLGKEMLILFAVLIFLLYSITIKNYYYMVVGIVLAVLVVWWGMGRKKESSTPKPTAPPMQPPP